MLDFPGMLLEGFTCLPQEEGLGRLSDALEHKCRGTPNPAPRNAYSDCVPNVESISSALSYLRCIASWSRIFPEACGNPEAKLSFMGFYVGTCLEVGPWRLDAIEGATSASTLAAASPSLRRKCSLWLGWNLSLIRTQWQRAPAFGFMLALFG